MRNRPSRSAATMVLVLALFLVVTTLMGLTVQTVLHHRRAERMVAERAQVLQLQQMAIRWLWAAQPAQQEEVVELELLGGDDSPFRGTATLEPLGDDRWRVTARLQRDDRITAQRIGELAVRPTASGREVNSPGEAFGDE